MLVFDIETGPLPLEAIQSTLGPFDASSTGKHPGEFHHNAVKLGRMVDEAKIAAKIEDARKAHESAIVAYEEKQLTAESDYWAGIQDKAALSAITGQVVAIGYLGKHEILHLATDGVSERALLVQFWKSYRDMRKQNRSMVGFNIKGFDLPFLAQRSWILEFPVPTSILTPTGYLDSSSVDLLDRWKVGYRGSMAVGNAKLATVARALGLGDKPDDCTGAEFAKKLWSESPEDRQAAEKYLSNDLAITAAVANRLGVS